MNNYHFTVTERFIRYVQIDTQSDPQSSSFPSTEKQKNLSRLLVDELKEIGIEDAFMDEHGYVIATIPANSNKKVPAICFCSHVDTAPDCSGYKVKPIIHYNYEGGNIMFPDDPNQVIGPEQFPYLLQKTGNDIITASGQTLLGADDKSGVAIIMDLANYLTLHPEIKHGEIKILFTPDEEVGRGTEKLDLKKLNAHYAYTLDGGDLGDFEDETFSADGAVLTIHGVSAHPGDAKGKMVNALKVAAEILMELPRDEWSPETTSGREGFVHPVRMGGNAEKTMIELIIRDFETSKLKKYANRLKALSEKVLLQYPAATYELHLSEQYRNMKEILDQYPEVAAYAQEAYKRAGIQLRNEPIRGGTDGSRLSFMGLPCPNIFTGMQAIHSKKEFIVKQDMEKAVEVLVNLVQIWEEKS